MPRISENNNIDEVLPSDLYRNSQLSDIQKVFVNNPENDYPYECIFKVIDLLEYNNGLIVIIVR